MPQRDLASWFTQEQAAEAIGCSTKHIRKLAAERKLQQASYRRPSGGNRIRVYHPQDVERVRRERNPEAPPFVVPPTSDELRLGAALEATRELAPLAPAAPGELLVTVLQGILEALRSGSSGTVDAGSGSSRTFLTFEEAAAYTGAPVRYLQRLVRERKLEATPTRPRLLRRRDLDAL